MSTNGTPPTGPLEHIKVLDLCLARAGPTCVRVLADMGAQVIQVIRPSEAGIDASLRTSTAERPPTSARSPRSPDRRGPQESSTAWSRTLTSSSELSQSQYRLRVDYETLRALNPASSSAAYRGSARTDRMPRPGVTR
jgi:formyl-CoA transferase